MNNVIAFRRPREIEKAESDRRCNADRAGQLQAFLDSVRHLGCSEPEPEYDEGRRYIQQMAIALTDERVPMPTLDQCLEVLHFMSFSVPISKRRCFGHNGTDEACGYNEVLDCIAQVIRTHLADD